MYVIVNTLHIGDCWWK